MHTGQIDVSQEKSINLDNSPQQIYVIASKEHEDDCNVYVSTLEASGATVCYPKRDIQDTDTTGYNTVLEYIQNIASCDEVHVLWDDSKGSHFELGAAMALSKKIVYVKSFYTDTVGAPSFIKVMQMWELSDVG